MQPILIVGIIIFTGFIFGEIAKKIKLPKVTGYIFAGILLNPSLFSLIPENFIVHTSLITNISLSIITFSVGGTLVYSRIKKLGKGILVITFFEAEFAFLMVLIGFLIATPFLIHLNNAAWFTVFIPVSILISALASPTDPTATLAIIHENKAKGDVASTIMSVAAFDDVLGIINYSLAIAIAGAFAFNSSFSINTTIVTPILTILGSIVLGSILGFILNGVTTFIKKKQEEAFVVYTLGMLLLCFGLATVLGVDELLSTMTMGIVVANFNPIGDRIFEILEHHVEELIFVLFFTLSGMHLNFSVLVNSYLLVLFFVIFRVIGKILGTMFGASVSKSSLRIKKYTAGGLIPQGGIVIGLAIIIKQNPAFNNISDIIITIIIGATVINELIGPVLSRMTLKKAGEIK
jgi:Kef-type K+ transport system membrane component KefB